MNAGKITKLYTFTGEAWDYNRYYGEFTLELTADKQEHEKIANGDQDIIQEWLFDEGEFQNRLTGDFEFCRKSECDTQANEITPAEPGTTTRPETHFVLHID